MLTFGIFATSLLQSFKELSLSCNPNSSELGCSKIGLQNYYLFFNVQTFSKILLKKIFTFLKTLQSTSIR